MTDHTLQELQVRSALLNTLLKQISDAALFVNLEGGLIFFNRAAASCLGMEERALGKKFWDLFPDDMFGFSMREALQFGISHKLLYCKEMEISTTFLYEGAKAHHGMLLVFRDLREKREWQRSAHRDDRMRELGKMAATVAHEIRNPLGGIRGYASLLYRDLEKSAHLQEMAGFILEGTKGLEKIVSAVLHYSKPVDIQAVTQDLGTFLKQLARFVKVDPAFPPHVRFFLHVPDAPQLVPFDATALKSALLNLIFNAIQAMPQGGELTISLWMASASVQIAVCDTGVGMDEEHQGALFSPFFTTKAGGNGLGLVETEKIVQAHCGTIDVRSKPGKGSTFTITLPLKR